ncbi:Glycosyl transferase [Colletotrichum scovillei]|nr:Glycosyl transferase [Colletotrichum scovillei]KAH8421884.1 Glycosyl transferase [Colletotrichum scovillei]KAH8421992.1 Glycosyl transferase [Colletotrichum scovillei]
MVGYRGRLPCAGEALPPQIGTWRLPLYTLCLPTYGRLVRCRAGARGRSFRRYTLVLVSEYEFVLE